MVRKLIMRMTRKDFEWQYFRAGGKGGQHQNKTNSGVRCIHRPSGSVGEARDQRQQGQNRRLAFRRCVETQAFRSWMKLEVARRQKNQKDVEASVNRAVERQMRPENLRIEIL